MQDSRENRIRKYSIQSVYYIGAGYQKSIKFYRLQVDEADEKPLKLHIVSTLSAEYFK